MAKPATFSDSLDRELDQFLRYLSLERGRSANTIQAYRQDLGRYFSWLRGLGLSSALNVSEAEVHAFISGLPGSPRSVQRALSAIRSFHSFLVETGVSAHHPAIAVASPKQPERLPKALSVEQVSRLIDSVTEDDPVGLRDRALLEVLYATGARVGEVVGLALDDVFDTEGDTASMLRVVGKGNRERLVPLGRRAQQAVEAYVVRARPVLAKASKKHSAALFLGQRGSALSRQSVWLVLQHRSQKVGLEGSISPHTLRHSCATHLLQGGADIRVVQELLGHQSVQTTQIYTKVTIDSLRDVFYSAHPRATG